MREDDEEEQLGRVQIFPASLPVPLESHLLAAACGSSGEDKHIRSDFLSVAPFEGGRAAPTTLALGNPADSPSKSDPGPRRRRGGESRPSRRSSANEFHFIFVRGGMNYGLVL